MRRLLVGLLVLLVVLGGYAAADAEDLVPGLLTLSPASGAQPPTDQLPGSGYDPSASPSTGPGGTTTDGWPPTGPLAAALAGPSTTAPQPSPAVLTARLAAALKPLGKGVSGEVMDVAAGHVLYSHNASTPRTPASTTKLLTAVSVLSTLGPDATLPTKVVTGARPSELVLVGGGDIRLAAGAGSPTSVFGRAGLGDLAASTAAELQAQGVSRVTVGFDDSMFSGPRLNPRWVPSDYRTGEVSPITDLGLASRAAQPGKAAPADPSLAAAQAFAHDLAGLGISVTGTPRRTRAASTATQLAVVQSAPIREILQLTMVTSDNTEAEVLSRLAARAAGGAGSFTGAAAQNVRAARALGVPVTGIRLYDGSGLARANLIPPRTLVSLLTTAATRQGAVLRGLFAGLPVAGWSGTLANRFADPKTRAAAGLVRAKTGTLSGVNTLAGVVVDADGRLLAFAFMASHPTAKTPPARPLLDRAATMLAGCGCR